LRCTDDRKWNLEGLDQIFLGRLCAKVTTFLKAVGADNRQGDVMTNTRVRFCGETITAGDLEEVQDGLSSNDGEFATSTTTCASASASASP
jgi:hypothetical protein